MTEIIPILLLGFGLGFMHALDADHIMAVSVLSSQKPGLGKTLRHSFHWALGHGGILLAAGALLFGLSIHIPSSLQYAAELSVGILLIALGLMCLRRFSQDNITLTHHHHGDIEHVHWQSTPSQPSAMSHSNGSSSNHFNKKHHAHKPVLIGMLHGLAGSAPALALIPAVARGQFGEAVLYLVIFSLGVMLSMLFFGLGFAKIQHFLSVRYAPAFRWSRYVIAFLSIGLGGFWLMQAV